MACQAQGINAHAQDVTLNPLSNEEDNTRNVKVDKTNQKTVIQAKKEALRFLDHLSDISTRSSFVGETQLKENTATVYQFTLILVFEKTNRQIN